MASNAAVIGALQVILGGDASALDKVLKGAQASVASFAKNVTSIAGGIGLEKAISGTIEKVVSTIKNGLDDVAKSAKGASVAGMAVDDFTKLRYGAEFSGVALENLSVSLTKLSENMVSVASGAVTPVSVAFDKMGLAVKDSDGTLKTSSTMLAEIADKFAGYKDGAAKATLAQTIFGEKGAELIPMLNRGRDGLAALGDEAQKYGLVLDGDTKFAVQSMNENLKRMDAIKQGLAVTIAAHLLPTFEQFSSAMLSAKEDSNLMNTAADGLATVIKGVVSVALQATVIISRLAAEVAAFHKWASAPLFNSGPEWDAYIAEGQKTKEVLDALKVTIANLWADSGASSWDSEAFKVKMLSAEVQRYGLAWTQTAAPIVKANEVTRDALQVFLDGQAKRTAGVAAEAAAVGKSADEQARLKVVLEAQAIAKARNINLDADAKASIKAAGDAAANAAQQLQAANLIQDNLAPQQQRNLLLQQYVDLLNAGKISLDTFSLAAMKVQFPAFSAAARSAQDFQLQVDQLATNSLNSLASTIAAVATGTKEAGAAFKAFAVQMVADLIAMIAKAVIFKLIMTAIGFAGGGPVGMGQSSGSTGLSLTGTGGLFDDGGYTGPGGKYQPAGIVHAGEVVFSQDDVAAWGGVRAVEGLRLNPLRLPSFDAGGIVSRVSNAPDMMMAQPSVVSQSQPQPSVVKTVVLQGFMWSRDQMRDMFEFLNEGLRDSHKLNLKFA
jgi:hypothetical protein